MLTFPSLHPTGGEIIDALEREGKPVILSMSCGKDAVAMWLQLRGRVEVIPRYYYLVPGLRFVERSLAYYEDFFRTPIMRVPNPKSYEMLRGFLFQPPARLPRIEGLKLPRFDIEDLNGAIRADRKLSKDTLVAIGTRAADGANRYAHFQAYGPYNAKKKTICPIWDMKIEQLVAILNHAQVKLPHDYAIWGRSFDGLGNFYLSKIKEHYPDDYETILQWFPLAGVESYRATLLKKHYGQDT